MLDSAYDTRIHKLLIICIRLYAHISSVYESCMRIWLSVSFLPLAPGQVIVQSLSTLFIGVYRCMYLLGIME